MSRIYICSLKFHPGLFKEILLLSEKFNTIAPTSNIMSKGYKNLFKNNTESIFLTNGIGIKGMIYDIFMFPIHFIKFCNSIKNTNEKKFFIFYNPHPLNFIYCLLINLFIKDSLVSTVLHEPYKSNKEKSVYGFFKFFYYYLVEITQKLSVSFSKIIITMSPYGANLFKNNFTSYKGLHIKSNLLINKPINIRKTRNTRCYFSFIGTVNKGKGIYEFIDLVNYSLKMNDDMKFCIITSSIIDEYIPLLSDNYLSKLTIINKQHISDEEINNVISQSFAVFSIHNVAAQSGVLPLAYSLLTPSIMRDIPAFNQYKIDDNLILPVDFNEIHIYNVCKSILLDQNNFSKYENKCELAFNKYFSEQNFESFYFPLINKL